MSSVLPNVSRVQDAVRLYLSCAYPGGGWPASVQAILDRLASGPPGEPVPESLFEAVTPEGYRILRLGQAGYPHMKMRLEPVPGSIWGSEGYLFRADAHDSHLHAPAGSPDAAPLAALRSQNQMLVEKIDAAWMAAGIPTFKEFLRRDLARKKSLRAGGS